MDRTRTVGINPNGSPVTAQERDLRMQNAGFGRTSQDVFDEMERDPDAPYLEWLYSTKAQNRKAKRYWDSFGMQATEGVSYGEAKANVLQVEEEKKRAEYAQRMQAVVADFLDKTKGLDDTAYKQAEQEFQNAVMQTLQVPQRQQAQPNPYGLIAGGIASALDPSKSAKYLQIPGQVAQQNEDMRFGNEAMQYKADMDARDEQIRFLMSRVSAEDRKLAEQMQLRRYQAGFAQDELTRMANEDAKRGQAEEAYRKGIRQLYQGAKSSNDKQVWGSQLVQLGELDPSALNAEVARMQTAESTKQEGAVLTNQAKAQGIEQKAQEFAWKKEDRPMKIKALEADLIAKGLRNDHAKQIIDKYAVALEFVRPEAEARLQLLKNHVNKSSAAQLQTDLNGKAANTVYRQASSNLPSIENTLQKAKSDYESLRQQWFDIDKMPDDAKYDPTSATDTRTNGQVSKSLRAMLEQKKAFIASIEADLEKRRRIIAAWEKKNMPAEFKAGYQAVTVGAPNTMNGAIGR